MLELILIIALLAADQLSKYLTDAHLALGSSAPLLEGVIQFTNVHNTGAAWGILPNARLVFLIVTPPLCILLALLLFRRRARIGLLGRICLSLLLAGAIGNYIDRALLGYVRDMFEFCFMSFPVFNVADTAITVGAVLLCVDTLFGREGTIFGALERIKPARTEPAADDAAGGEEAAPVAAADGAADSTASEPASGMTADVTGSEAPGGASGHA